MQGSQERVADCTTSNFDGLICMLHPEESWVAKWQRIGAHRRAGGNTDNFAAEDINDKRGVRKS